MAEAEQMVVDPKAVIQDRLDDLLARRDELDQRLQQELSAALAPLDASIKELRWMLAQLDGQGAAPPNYNLVKRSPAQQPRRSPSESAQMHQFQPRRTQPSEDMPPPETVMSPKSKTPVATNVAILKKKLQGG